MERNARRTNELESRSMRLDGTGRAPEVPPFTLTPLGADPALGWSGWGAGSLAPWAAAQAELARRRGKGDAQDRPRRAPRDR